MLISWRATSPWRSEHSTVNYKDGLAITGKAPIILNFPLIPGIDLAGRVLRSEDPRYQAGDRVVLNGYGLGEVHHGGYAERARVKGDWLIVLPENISTVNAMAIGTAGYTAMLCVLALENAGVTPDKGDVLVTLLRRGGVGRDRVLDKLCYRGVASPAGPSRNATICKDSARTKSSTLASFRKRGSHWPRSVGRRGGHARQPNPRNVLSQIRYDGAVAACGWQRVDLRDRSALHCARRDTRGRELGVNPP